MKIFLHEIKESETEFSLTQNDAWVRESVEKVDEEPVEATPGQKASEREIKAHLSLRKVDEIYVISGEVRTKIRLNCSRCATPFMMECKPRFSALFCKDPVMAGVPYFLSDSQDEGRGAKNKVENRKVVGKNKGFARHAHDFSGDGVGFSDSENTERDVDITYLSEESIQLGDVLTEQLRLQIPFRPLCKEDCKGMCQQCGADLNKGRCACAKIATSSPFSVLAHLKM